MRGLRAWLLLALADAVTSTTTYTTTPADLVPDLRKLQGEIRQKRSEAGGQGDLAMQQFAKDLTETEKWRNMEGSTKEALENNEDVRSDMESVLNQLQGQGSRLLGLMLNITKTTIPKFSYDQDKLDAKIQDVSKHSRQDLMQQAFRLRLKMKIAYKKTKAFTDRQAYLNDAVQRYIKKGIDKSKKSQEKFDRVATRSEELGDRITAKALKSAEEVDQDVLAIEQVPPGAAKNYTAKVKATLGLLIAAQQSLAKVWTNTDKSFMKYHIGKGKEQQKYSAEQLKYAEGKLKAEIKEISKPWSQAKETVARKRDILEDRTRTAANDDHMKLAEQFGKTQTLADAIGTSETAIGEWQTRVGEMLHHSLQTVRDHARAVDGQRKGLVQKFAQQRAKRFEAARAMVDESSAEVKSRLSAESVDLAKRTDEATSAVVAAGQSAIATTRGAAVRVVQQMATYDQMLQRQTTTRAEAEGRINGGHMRAARYIQHGVDGLAAMQVALDQRMASFRAEMAKRTVQYGRAGDAIRTDLETLVKKRMKKIPGLIEVPLLNTLTRVQTLYDATRKKSLTKLKELRSILGQVRTILKRNPGMGSELLSEVIPALFAAQVSWETTTQKAIVDQKKELRRVAQNLERYSKLTATVAEVEPTDVAMNTFSLLKESLRKAGVSASRAAGRIRKDLKRDISRGWDRAHALKEEGKTNAKNFEALSEAFAGQSSRLALSREEAETDIRETEDMKVKELLQASGRASAAVDRDMKQVMSEGDAVVTGALTGEAGLAKIHAKEEAIGPLLEEDGAQLQAKLGRFFAGVEADADGVRKKVDEEFTEASTAVDKAKLRKSDMHSGFDAAKRALDAFDRSIAKENERTAERLQAARTAAHEDVEREVKLALDREAREAVHARDAFNKEMPVATERQRVPKKQNAEKLRGAQNEVRAEEKAAEKATGAADEKSKSLASSTEKGAKLVAKKAAADEADQEDAGDAAEETTGAAEKRAEVVIDQLSKQSKEASDGSALESADAADTLASEAKLAKVQAFELRAGVDALAGKANDLLGEGTEKGHAAAANLSRAAGGLETNATAYLEAAAARGRAFDKRFGEAVKDGLAREGAYLDAFARMGTSGDLRLAAATGELLARAMSDAEATFRDLEQRRDQATDSEALRKRRKAMSRVDAIGAQAESALKESAALLQNLKAQEKTGERFLAGVLSEVDGLMRDFKQKLVAQKATAQKTAVANGAATLEGVVESLLGPMSNASGLPGAEDGSVLRSLENLGYTTALGTADNTDEDDLGNRTQEILGEEEDALVIATDQLSALNYSNGTSDDDPVWQELDSMEQQENPNTRQQDRWKELAGALADDAATDVAEAVNESSGSSFLQTTARAQVAIQGRRARLLRESNRAMRLYAGLRSRNVALGSEVSEALELAARLPPA